MSARLLALALLAAAALWPHPAHASIACTFTTANAMSFGTASPLAGASTDISQAFTVQCNSAKSDISGAVGSTRTVNVCLSYNNGSAGASSGGNRQMTNGSANAVYDLYTTGAYGPTHWGSRSGAPTGTVAHVLVTLTKPSGSTVANVSANVSTFARLFGSQTTLAPGSYSSSLTLTGEAFWNDLKSDCAAGGTPDSSPTATQQISVTYQKECQVGTVNTLDFGNTGFLTGNVDSSTSVSVTCTSGTGYKVGLDAGSAGGTTSSRKMTRMTTPASTVSYGLYRDSNRVQNWGNDTANGTDTQNGSGSGSAASYPIYGRVPPQATPEPGSYQDTVVLTVAF